MASVFGLVWLSGNFFPDFQYYLAGFHHSFVTISITTLICVAREKQLTRYFFYIINKMLVFVFYPYFSSIVADMIYDSILANRTD